MFSVFLSSGHEPTVCFAEHTLQWVFHILLDLFLSFIVSQCPAQIGPCPNPPQQEGLMYPWRTLCMLRWPQHRSSACPCLHKNVRKQKQKWAFQLNLLCFWCSLDSPPHLGFFIFITFQFHKQGKHKKLSVFVIANLSWLVVRTTLFSLYFSSRCIMPGG